MVERWGLEEDPSFDHYVSGAFYPTGTGCWHTPVFISKWPSDTEPWGNPPTEYPSEASEALSIPSIIGVCIACVTAVVIIIVCTLCLIKGHRLAVKKKRNGYTTINSL